MYVVVWGVSSRPLREIYIYIDRIKRSTLNHSGGGSGLELNVKNQVVLLLTLTGSGAWTSVSTTLSISPRRGVSVVRTSDSMRRALKICFRQTRYAGPADAKTRTGITVRAICSRCILLISATAFTSLAADSRNVCKLKQKSNIVCHMLTNLSLQYMV